MLWIALEVGSENAMIDIILLSSRMDLGKNGVEEADEPREAEPRKDEPREAEPREAGPREAGPDAGRLKL